MIYDKDAAAVEAAALDCAADMTARIMPRGARLVRDSAALRALLVTAFIAGHSHAKQDTVQATDALLASINTGARS
jgi:hypothetical protein